MPSSHYQNIEIYFPSVTTMTTFQLSICNDLPFITDSLLEMKFSLKQNIFKSIYSYLFYTIIHWIINYLFCFFIPFNWTWNFLFVFNSYWIQNKKYLYIFYLVSYFFTTTTKQSIYSFQKYFNNLLNKYLNHYKLINYLNKKSLVCKNRITLLSIKLHKKTYKIIDYWLKIFQNNFLYYYNVYITVNILLKIHKT